MRNAGSATIVVVTIAWMVWAVATAAVFAEEPKVERGAPVTPRVFDGDVRDLPAVRPWQPGDPIRAVPHRFYTPPGTQLPAATVPAVDPLLERQLRAMPRSAAGSGLFTQPSRNLDGQGFVGAFPPDTVGDVGPTLFIQSVNATAVAEPPFNFSSHVRIYDKSQPVPAVIATFLMDSLFAGACAGFADPIVLYDEQADRWLLAEISFAGNSVCVYLSQSSDPVAGGWYLYEFNTPALPDYPKFGVWATDANLGAGSYVLVTNEGDPSAVYALDRGQMLLGAAATTQRFTVPQLTSFGIPAPADTDGVAPPAGAPAIVMRPRDTELNGGPAAPGDLLEMWFLDVDWIDPGNSTLAAAPSIDVAEFNSDLCQLVAPCFQQPGGAPPLEPLNWFLMHRLQYRNRGAHESLVGNFTVDVNGLDQGGVRWFELRRPGGGAWVLHQEGTYAPGGDNRWVGSLASDAAGNLALGFNVVSPSTFPSLRYTGRRSFDSAGVMSQTETEIAPGVAAEDSSRYGDYSAMSVDPADGCTFWFTGEYSVAAQWRTRIASFRFENCPCSSPPIAPPVQAFAAVDNRIDVSWDDSPSDNATEYLVQRSLAPDGPFTTVATVADSSPGAGGGPGYAFQDNGVSGGITYDYVVTALDDSSCPSGPGLEASATATGACLLPPAFGGVQSATSGGATCSIELSWSAAAAACGGPVTYDLHRDTVPAFAPSPANLLAAGLVSTQATDANGLVEGTDYYYLVRAVDQATGLDDGNLVYRATTATGITPGGSQTQFAEDFEAPDVLTASWSVGTGPGPHVCGAWERVDDPGFVPNGGSGFYARSLSQGCSRTSTFLDSPAIDLSAPEIQSATLLCDIRFAVGVLEQATVEAWNGSSWDVVSPNFSSVNGFQFFDVSPQALGNPAFQVRFNYQNATDDEFYSVDDVSVVAELQFGSQCATSNGVSPVPDGSGGTAALTATRLDAAGTLVEIQYDAATCAAPEYNLLYGSLAGVASTSLDGGVCDIGTGAFAWNAVPAGDLFFLVVGYDGSGAESRWGDATAGERNGLTASGQCGAAVKNISLSCP